MKPDSPQIRQFIDDLAREPWLGRARAKWVKYAFHFSELDNAVGILRSERILSRANLQRTSHIPVDIACNEIISQTDDEVQNSVRLYFRPLTPTQFNMEGFRPRNHLIRNSHCRVPIFFLFDLKDILCRDDSRFSPVNLAIMATSGQLCSTAEELSEFNFREIFHEGPFSPEKRSQIIAHRNAEIIVPDELDLASLKLICCRSQAEKDTLFDLLPPQVLSNWESRIYVLPGLYKRNWVFIETTYLSSTGVNFMFSPDAQHSGPFHMELTVTVNGQSVTMENPAFLATGSIPYAFQRPIDRYRVQLKLDGHIAYSGKYDSRIDDIPF